MFSGPARACLPSVGPFRMGKKRVIEKRLATVGPPTGSMQVHGMRVIPLRSSDTYAFDYTGI